MEAVICVLRPKQSVTLSQVFHPGNYSVLLVDVNNSGRSQKGLLKNFLSFEEEASESLLTFLYKSTGSEHGGLRGKRSVFIPTFSAEVQSLSSEPYVKGTLYFVPVECIDRLDKRFTDRVTHNPGFYPLDVILQQISTEKNTLYTKQTCAMLKRLESWLKEKHKVPGAIDLLFSVSSEFRLKRSLTNPAYITDNHWSSMGMSHLSSARSMANEALAKMMDIEKCEITVTNNSFNMVGAKHRADAFTVNRYWGKVVPDYSKISQGLHGFSSLSNDPSWLDEFPLHRCAFEGDAEGIKSLLKSGSDVAAFDKEHWAPIHYAAWNGHLDAVSLLVGVGQCDPNLTNRNGDTALHFAARRGHPAVVERLLTHADIHVLAQDKDNYTPMDLCQSSDKPECKEAARLIEKAINKIPKIHVKLMDGTRRLLKLIRGTQTTVQDLRLLMMEELNLPSDCHKLFTIWICSRNLQLQLKNEHKPLQQLGNWQAKIVPRLTTYEADNEEPELYLRREALLSLEEEKKVKHPVAISLLFHEAYKHYLKSLFPISEMDAVLLGGALLHIFNGPYHPNKVKQFFQRPNALNDLIPLVMLKVKPGNWESRLSQGYQKCTERLGNNDRPPPGKKRVIPVQVLHTYFLQICWNLVVYGSAFFTGSVQVKNIRTPVQVHIGVNDIGLHLIKMENKTIMQTYRYTQIEWVLGQDKLEIRFKETTNGTVPRNSQIRIMTKQAGLIKILMTKHSGVGA